MKVELVASLAVVAGVVLLTQGCGVEPAPSVAPNSSTTSAMTTADAMTSADAMTTADAVTTAEDSNSTTTTSSAPSLHSTSTMVLTSTVTLLPPPRRSRMSQPLSVDQVLEKLNTQFHAYNPTDSFSQLGVTITWIKNSDDKLKLYCPEVAGSDSSGCYDASASCRMSASLHNKHTPLDADGSMLSFADRPVGVVFRQELVEDYFGKCAFIYDGSSNNRYNYGCGNLATVDHEHCDDEYSAYGNFCPSTGEKCIALDVEVTSGSCDNFGGHANGKLNCFYKAASFAISLDEALSYRHYDGIKMWSTTSELRTMLNDRVDEQQTYDCGSSCWNEIILDERLLMTQLWWDPATVVDAIVYEKGASAAWHQAKRIQEAFEQQWGAAPPLLAVDKSCNAADPACGPFSPSEIDLLQLV